MRRNNPDISENVNPLSRFSLTAFRKAVNCRAMKSAERTTCPPEILKWTYSAFLKEMRRRQTERELDELTTPFVPYYCVQQEEEKCL